MINNSGVLLIANYRVGSEASSFAAIPSEVLQSLSALPVGGVRGTNRGDSQVSSDRFSVRNTDPQVRLMTLNQTSTRSDSDQEPQRTTPTDQSPSAFSRTGKPAAETGRPSASALSTLFKNLSSNLEGVWRGALDNLFMDGPWQGRLNEWLERLPVAPSTSLDEGIGLESASEGQEGFETTLLNSFSDDAPGSAAPGWAYAGLLLGMGAVVGKDMKKRHSRMVAGSPWDK